MNKELTGEYHEDVNSLMEQIDGLKSALEIEAGRFEAMIGLADTYKDQVQGAEDALEKAVELSTANAVTLCHTLLQLDQATQRIAELENSLSAAKYVAAMREGQRQMSIPAVDFAEGYAEFLKKNKEPGR